MIQDDLQPVGAPASVALVNRDPTIVAPLLPLLTTALEEQSMHLHDAVDARYGDLSAEISDALRHGADGFFTDFPAIGAAVLRSE